MFKDNIDCMISTLIRLKADIKKKGFEIGSC